jgi:serine/threonine protein kinase
LLCYATGRTVELSDAGVVPSEVLARILGVPVSKSDAESWAAASHAEDPETILATSTPSSRRRLGDFEVVSELGRGAMGVVYKAWQPALGRMVALKVQPRPGDEKADARFRREVRALARVDHPHLVKVYSSGYDGEQFFYAMELIEGAPLAAVCDALTRDGAATTAVDLTEWKAAIGAAQHPLTAPPTATSEPTPKSLATPTIVGEVMPLATLVDDRHPTGSRGYLRRIVRLLQQVSEAAHALHEAGVLHRDIKPGNVLVTADGEQAVLMDLGLAQLADDTEGRLTRTRQFVGTLRYASPQQVMAVGTLDRRSDVYSLGATLWELLTLRPLFGATEKTPIPELMERIQRDEPQRLGRVNPEGGRDLEAVVHKCLEKEPDHRYASARELADDLGRWLDGEPVVARPVRGWERAVKWMRRRPILAGLSAALVAAMIYATVSSWILLGRVQREAETARAQRDDADAQRRRMQATLDDMLSEESLAYLTTQKELLPEQRAFLERAVKYYTEFAGRAPTDVEGRRLVAAALTRVARIHQSLGRAADAEQSFHAALAAHEELARLDPGQFEFRRAIGLDHNNLARLLAEHGRMPDAKAEYHSAIDVQGQLVQSAPANPDFRRDLAESRSNFGRLLDDLNRLSEADTELRAALGLQSELYVANPADSGIRRSLARTHVHLCHLLINLHKPVEAVAEMQSALALQQQLVAEARSSAEDRGALATSYQGLGILLNTLGQRAESDDANHKSLAIRERLAADYPGVPIYAVDLGVSYYNLGEQAFNRGETAASRDFYSKAISVLEPMFRTHPAHATLREALCYVHWGLALALDKTGQGSDALREWDRSLEVADNRLQTALRLGRAGTLARLGDSQKARAIVDGLTQATGLEPDVLYEFARVWALIGANSPPPDGEQGLVRAVAALQTAFTRGYSEFERVLTDPDLVSLRGRDDFAALLWAWADAPMQAPTAAVSAQ